jgi:hypothetical protein
MSSGATGVAKTTAPDVHCPHASLLGGGQCASDLKKRQYIFCMDFKKTCSSNGAPYMNCEAAVTSMVVGKTGADAATEDSFGCREYHVGVAKTTAPEVHCNHAALLGGGQCASDLKKRQYNFCTDFKKTCASAGTPYTNCESAISWMAPGSKDATSGDSFGCREYHLGNDRDFWYMFENPSTLNVLSLLLI